MFVFNLIAGVCSIVGLGISVWTLVTARRTKNVLASYKFQVDCEEQLNILRGARKSTCNDNMDMDKKMANDCMFAARRIKNLHKATISPELSGGIEALLKSTSSVKKNPQDENVQEEAKVNLSDVCDFLEKELASL